MRVRFPIIAILAGVTTLGLVGWWIKAGNETPFASGQILLPNDPAVVELGQNIYAKDCASCHGVNLEGQTPEWRSPGPDGKLPAPPHDETGHTWHHPDALLVQITKIGPAAAANLTNYKSAMPAYEGILSDDEIIAVLSFIKSTWPKDVQARHNQLNAQYERK